MHRVLLRWAVSSQCILAILQGLNLPCIIRSLGSILSTSNSPVKDSFNLGWLLTYCCRPICSWAGLRDSLIVRRGSLWKVTRCTAKGWEPHPSDWLLEDVFELRSHLVASLARHCISMICRFKSLWARVFHYSGFRSCLVSGNHRIEICLHLSGCTAISPTFASLTLPTWFTEGGPTIWMIALRTIYRLTISLHNLIILSALEEDQVKVCFFVLVAGKPIDIDSKIWTWQMLHLVICIVPLNVSDYVRTRMLHVTGDLVYISLILVENCMATPSARSSQVWLSLLLYVLWKFTNWRSFPVLVCRPRNYRFDTFSDGWGVLTLSLTVSTTVWSILGQGIGALQTLVNEYSLSGITNLVNMLAINANLLPVTRCKLGYLLHDAHFFHVSADVRPIFHVFSLTTFPRSDLHLCGRHWATDL